MISKKTKHGLKVLIYLARRYEQGPILIAELAREERIPRQFLENILLARRHRRRDMRLLKRVSL